jgi:GT2 family glycosyltransferase
MKLSVVVVNHNRCDLLKLTLNSLIKSANGVDSEVIIVDNASTDTTIEVLNADYPQLRVIANKVNEGIAKAANQGIQASRGEYILLVNPDVILGKETLEKVTGYMNEHEDVSGLGVRMLGPQGAFLQESNRGLTKPWISFFKLTGLAKHFPKSRLTNRNNKEWVQEFQTSEIDILNGAFMLVRRNVFNEIGGFDERFQLYGYDIDLSYRMRLAGFKNYYYPKTYIINFKSQSIPKFSWTFIKHFYGAMFIFASKYLFKLPEIKVPGIQLYPAQYEVER